jgi:hypothetical protein
MKRALIAAAIVLAGFGFAIAQAPQFATSQPPLGYVAENAANKGAASGYASLDSTTKVPDAQLPADQCTLTKYTVAFNDTALNASSATPSKTLFTAASTSVRVCLVEIAGTTSFTGITNLTAATVKLASSAGTPMLYSPNQDIFGTVGATTNNYWSDAGNTMDRANLGVVAYFTFTCSSGNCYGSGLSAGSVSITVGTRTMP